MNELHCQHESFIGMFLSYTHVLITLSIDSLTSHSQSLPQQKQMLQLTESSVAPHPKGAPLDSALWTVEAI